MLRIPSILLLTLAVGLLVLSSLARQDTILPFRVTVGGQTRFVCVDGPEFDGHKVDWNSLLSRLSFYRDEEKKAVEHWEHKCRLDGTMVKGRE